MLTASQNYTEARSVPAPRTWETPSTAKAASKRMLPLAPKSTCLRWFTTLLSHGTRSTLIDAAAAATAYSRENSTEAAMLKEHHRF